MECLFFAQPALQHLPCSRRVHTIQSLFLGLPSRAEALFHEAHAPHLSEGLQQQSCPPHRSSRLQSSISALDSCYPYTFFRGNWADLLLFLCKHVALSVKTHALFNYQHRCLYCADYGCRRKEMSLFL